MNQNEWAEGTGCSECGAQLSPERNRAFACSPETYLCFACAEARGGVYDAQQDRWIVPPDAAGLDDERRPHL